VLLTGCTGGGSNDPSIGRQLSGSQAVIISLQNAPDLSHLFLPYNGAREGVQAPGSATVGEITGGGTVQVGEINLLLANVGGSTSAGGLFVSGYDPNLIEIRARAGERPINDGTSKSSCAHNVVVGSGDVYDVMVFCQRTDGITVGGRTTNQGTDITLGNIPVGDLLTSAIEEITGKNVGWISRSGLFNSGRVDCSFRDGGQSCRIMFGNPNADPNRALYGFLLLNMLYTEIANCENNCRLFPPRFETGQVLYGVSPEYPNGDSIYMNYDIFVKRDRWPTLLNELDQRLQITACYYYSTTITPTVCIDPDPSSTRNDPCDGTAPMIWRGSQGAPIQVSKIQPRSTPGGTLFDIEVRHVGNGNFFQPGSLDQCGPYSPSRPDLSRQQVVQLLSARVAGELQQLRCTPVTTDPQSDKELVLVRMQNGVGRLSCYYSYDQIPLRSRQAYQTALTLEFGYLYQNVVTKDITIHRI
jgi:hypothetical protein